MYDLIRVAAAVPNLAVADTTYNTEEIISLIKEASAKGVKVLVFPELCISAYTCADLFFQSPLLNACVSSLANIIDKTQTVDMVIAVSLPIACDNQTFNCTVVLNKGKILGIVPKTYLPNYNEFYEERWFSSSADLVSKEITLCGQTVPIGNDLIFTSQNVPNLSIGIEICEDLWAPIPPSSYLAMGGATVILNPSASNELATKHEYRRSLVSHQSANTISAYIYASASVGESTQDLVFSGHSMICENGSLFKESKRFSKERQLIVADVDLEQLANDRKKNTTFMAHKKAFGLPYFRTIYFEIEKTINDTLERNIIRKPFVPKDDHKLNERCSDIFNIQLSGLAKRFVHTHAKSLVIGISGGLDSTLALLVAAKACDYIGVSRKSIIGVTMPGFGTTDRTYNNAVNLMNALGITTKEISIKAASLQHFKDIDHNVNIHNVTYENTQARERTQILMDLANKENGLVVGTGDLSELALGWATYNGDHMSMYGVNSGVPKTLVRVLVNYVAISGNLDEASKTILLDILDTPVSPELLPPDKNGEINQKTEDIVGPYELHDFFLYYIVRFGFSPGKIMYFAENAFADVYSKEIILKWLKNFYRRFFNQQFKRSCLPDGPKVGTINLSPRGDWRMPSDAIGKIWIDEVEKL
ncbi:MAG TPA: NAD(+) synthase [Lachnospiraceae bacterium]|nr:NAD(+) synthase [Lachnospiraceae bacterium]